VPLPDLDINDAMIKLFQAVVMVMMMMMMCNDETCINS